MKRLFAVITFIAYLATSTGMVVSFHYCMNRLASAELFASENKLCDRCGMHKEKQNKCCHDEVKIIKVQDEQQKAQVISSLEAPIIAVAEVPEFIQLKLNTSAPFVWNKVHSPPPLLQPAIYLQNCVFRI